jgi:hypothetical protein
LALVRTDVFEELIASIIRVTIIGELGITLTVTSKVAPGSSIVSLIMELIRSYEASVLARAIRHNIPGDGIRHSHSRENLKSYIGKAYL